MLGCFEGLGEGGDVVKGVVRQGRKFGEKKDVVQVKFVYGDVSYVVGYLGLRRRGQERLLRSDCFLSGGGGSKD